MTYGVKIIIISERLRVPKGPLPGLDGIVIPKDIGRVHKANVSVITLVVA
jgi:hypothetical protein